MTANLQRRSAIAPAHVAEWTTVGALAQDSGRWSALARRAAEPNPFYGPDYLISCARDLERDDIRCLVLYRDTMPDADMVGFFPMMRGRLVQGALIPTAEFYQNDYICSTAPLLDPEDPVGVCHSFLSQFGTDRFGPRTALARMLPADRAATRALRQALDERGHHHAIISSFVRAAIETPLGTDAYLALASSNRRKDLRRREKRLSEQGAVSVRTATDGPELRMALADFLRIEAAGWKGQSRTAMDCDPATRRLAERVFAGPGAEIDLLALDGRAIALCASLVTQDVKYTVKITYDEEFRAFSPFALLDRAMLAQFTAGGRHRRADSCAMPGQQVEGIWHERERIDFAVFALSPSVTPARIRSLGATLSSFNRLKSWLKQHKPAD